MIVMPGSMLQTLVHLHARTALKILTLLMMALCLVMTVLTVRHVPQVLLRAKVLSLHHQNQHRHQRNCQQQIQDALLGPLNLALVVYVLHAPKDSTNL
jgi:hypothetical protein